MSAPRPVTVTALGWGWRHGGRRAWAVERLDLTVPAGQKVLLLGPSGSGKSTLLAALAGVLGDDEGGEERGLLTLDGARPRASAGRAGLVLQDPESQGILPRLGDDVAFGPENLGVPADEIARRVPDALAAVGLDLPLDASTTRLSGGQKQRLALAGVLAMNAGLVLLDEPTANLDPTGVVEVRDTVIAAVDRAGATLVVVEHRVATWLGHVDRVVVLGERGAVVADGDPDAVLSEHGEALARLGIWVPGRIPTTHLSSGPGVTLLATDGLVVGRDRCPLRLVPDLELRAGELVGLAGANGTGKTTLALTLGGLLPPVSGAVVPGEGLAGGLRGGPFRWRSRDLLGRIALVFQSPQHQFLSARVRDELSVGLAALRRPAAERAARVDELLARLGLVDLADANPHTLSGGQQRRLSVGSALAAAPRLLLLDEPTFGQDARTWAALVGLLGDAVHAGSGVLAISHDPALLDLATRRIRLDPVPVAA